jgi:hypothetical protein
MRFDTDVEFVPLLDQVGLPEWLQNPILQLTSLESLSRVRSNRYINLSCEISEVCDRVPSCEELIAVRRESNLNCFLRYGSPRRGRSGCGACYPSGGEFPSLPDAVIEPE